MKEYGEFLNEEDRMMVGTIRDFVRKEIIPVRQQLDEIKTVKLCNMFWMDWQESVCTKGVYLSQ